MNTALWIVQGLLAAGFLFAGASKLAQHHDKLTDQMGWPGDFSPGFVNTIGGLEVLGALGLILPGIFDTAPELTPIAAVGLALVQVGAVVVHIRRKEIQMIFINIILIALAAFVAWGRFGDYPL